MLTGLARVVASHCARRRGDCMGMAAAGAVFMSVPAEAASKHVFQNLGLVMIALGLAATAVAVASRRG